MTDDLDHAHLERTLRTKMHLVPAPHLDARPFGVQTFPALIGLAMAALVLALKALPILATGSQLAGKALRGATVEDPIAFDPQQTRRLDVGQASQEGRASVPAGASNDGMQPPSQQQSHDGTQLTSGHYRRQFRRS